MRKLKQICAELACRPEAVEDLLAALQDEGSEKISTYEFLSSGAVRELKAYLHGKATHAHTLSERKSQSIGTFHQRVARFAFHS